MRSIRIVLCCLCLASGVPSARCDPAVGSPAEDARPLSLSSAVHEALERNSDLSASRLRVDIAMARVRLAKAVAEREWRYEGGLLGSAAENIDPLFWYSYVELSNQLSLTVADGGKARDEKAAAVAEAVLARAEYDEAVAELALEVTRAFWNVVAAEREAETVHAGAELLAEHFRMAQARFREGDAPELDVLRVRTGLVGADSEQYKANAALATARQGLAVLLGRDADVEFPPVDSSFPPLPDDPEAEEAARMALDRDPDVRVAEAEAALARAGLRVARSEGRGDLDFVVGYTGGTDVTGARHLISAGLRWSLPANDHGASDAREDAAQAGMRAEEAELEQARRRTAGRVQSVLAELAAARSRLGSLDQAAELAATVHEKATIGYEEGALSMRDLLAAHYDLTQAERDRVRAACELQTLRAELTRLIGSPPETRTQGGAQP